MLRWSEEGYRHGKFREIFGIRKESDFYGLAQRLSWLPDHDLDISEPYFRL